MNYYIKLALLGQAFGTSVRMLFEASPVHLGMPDSWQILEMETFKSINMTHLYGQTWRGYPPGFALWCCVHLHTPTTQVFFLRTLFSQLAA